MSVNILDLIILIPLLLWARQGYNKGLIISVASFAALILGLYFAFFFSDYTDSLEVHMYKSVHYALKSTFMGISLCGIEGIVNQLIR